MYIALEQAFWTNAIDPNRFSTDPEITDKKRKGKFNICKYLYVQLESE